MTDSERQRCISRLRFPPKLEHAFQEDYYQHARTTMRIGCAVFTLLMIWWGMAGYLAGKPASHLWVTLGIWIVADLVGILGLALLRSLWPWQPALLLIYSCILPYPLAALAAGYLRSTGLTNTAAQVQGFLNTVIFQMVIAAVIMRLPWLWATLALASTFVLGLRTAVAVLHAPLAEAFLQFRHGGPEGSLIVLSLAVYLQERLSRAAFIANHFLDEERAKSEHLLLNVLPQAIAERLKATREPIADDHAEVSVLFADIVDFTPFVASKPAREVLQFLNELFSCFDRLVETAGLEKIKTVGDCYMVIAGAPTPRPDHLEAIARFALAMQSEAERFSRERGLAVRFRVGLHTGPLIAGVIGEKRFSYDVWGDTVNTASRLESHGVPGRIQVSGPVAEKLREQFHFTYRGPVDLKGRGTLDTYFLEGERVTGGCLLPALEFGGEGSPHSAGAEAPVRAGEEGGHS